MLEAEPLQRWWKVGVVCTAPLATCLQPERGGEDYVKHLKLIFGDEVLKLSAASYMTLVLAG